MTALLFAVTVLAWGFTWFAIKLQIGPVPMEVSICYRFAIAAATLWAGLALTGRLRRVPLRGHVWFAVLGVTLFALNYLLIYHATAYVTSGVIAVIFSAASVFNAFNQWLIMGRAPNARVLIGAGLGIAGIALLFGREMAATGSSGLGIALALGGTYVFSLGNVVSTRATAGGTDLPNAVVRCMSWGAALLAVYAAVRGGPFVLDGSPVYLASLLYLAVPGSVLAFLAYLSLVARVGADRAAYATVLFPVVALTVSTVLEGYEWSPGAFLGLGLILAGNIAIFGRWPLPARSNAGRSKPVRGR
ncbi:DMT family transporter [Kaustia mangrovi]|uniref:DMT family transporter n=1 Tax=Kaustia mangrovi TaxID=2593653 RepID=A0A7S8HAW1_9HYPH|nr:DMT family transporter [Kaustia mangrovi]QPC41881.1 DMT family transporter [Kaustia mangrovi]